MGEEPCAERLERLPQIHLMAHGPVLSGWMGGMALRWKRRRIFGRYVRVDDLSCRSGQLDRYAALIVRMEVGAGRTESVDLDPGSDHLVLELVEHNGLRKPHGASSD